MLQELNFRSLRTMGLIAILSVSLSSIPAYGENNSLPSNAKGKISRALAREVEFLTSHPHYDHPVPVIVRVNREFFESRPEQIRCRPRALPAIKYA